MKTRDKKSKNENTRENKKWHNLLELAYLSVRNYYMF